MLSNTGCTGRLPNIFVCEKPSADGEKPPLQFPPPPKLAELVFCREPTHNALPRIDLYSRRPVFDSEYTLHGPGYDPDTRILVHGFDVEPLQIPKAPSQALPALERLPRHLRQLLSGFCFGSDADLANTIAVLISGVLIGNLISCGKPVVLLDGNQPGVGKTLLARTIALVLDGAEPRLISFTPDDNEIRKSICATLREDAQSVLIIDNAKLKSSASICSPTIEANSVAPVISIRILGESLNLTRPNDLLWFVTMNSTKTSSDLLSRGVPIRLAYEGDPGSRKFAGPDPVDYALQHRAEILGELAGMVLYWNQAGRPQGTKLHRLQTWAKLVGGVLTANGLPEFLQNLAQAAADFSSDLDAIAALAERAVKDESTIIVEPRFDGDLDSVGMKPGELEPLLRQAGVLVEKLNAAKSAKSKTTIIGNLLAPLIDREVPIETLQGPGKARLRARTGRSKARLYYFNIEYDAPDASRTLPQTVPAPTAADQSNLAA